MRDESQPIAARTWCSDKIMDRGWGRAPVVVVGDSERPIKVDVRSLNVNVIAGLEDALMRALGEGIKDAIHSQPSNNGLILGDTQVRGEGDPAVLGLASANDSCVDAQYTCVGAESPDLARLNAFEGQSYSGSEGTQSERDDE